MRLFYFCTAFVLFTAAARADEAADKPCLVLNTGGHTAPVHKVMFTPDGKEVITVSEDRTVRFWDAASGERLGVLRLPVGQDRQGELHAAALSGDGKSLAVGGKGVGAGGDHVYPVYLIDPAAGRVMSALRQKSEVWGLALSHDGARLAASCLDNKIYLWDVVSGKLLHTLGGHKAPARDLAFSPDDKVLASASYDKTARLWSVEDGKPVCPPLMHEDKLLCVAWKDNDTLATGGTLAAQIHLWDRAGRLVHYFEKARPGSTQIESLAFVPGKNELFYTWTEHFVGGGNAYVNTQSGGALLDLGGSEKSHDGYGWRHRYTEVRGALSPDGSLAASSGSGDGRVVLWPLNKEGRQVVRLRGRGAASFWAGWGPAGYVVGWTPNNGAGGEVLERAFDLEQLRFAPRPDKKFLRTAHARDDLRLIWSFGHDLAVRRGDETVTTLANSGNIVGCYALLPGGRFAVADNDKVNLYDARTGKPMRALRGHSGRVWELAVSPDDRYLLGACSDQTLRVWDPDKSEPLLSLFAAGADWVAWTGEGYYAASPGGEALMGWQVNSGPDRSGAFYSAAQFHQAFYRPDVIKRVLTEGSVVKALAAADKAVGKASEALDVARALPPEVNILAPAADDPKIADMEVKADAKSKDRAVVSLRLLIDGRPFPGAEVKKFPDARAGDKQEATWAVKKPEGDHALSVFAESDVSSAASPPVAVSYKKEAREPLPTLYVVAVGINAYPGSLQLNWAVDDANAVAKTFRAEAAPKPFGKVEMKVLLDKDATKEGVLDGLDWLKQNMTADDTAVVFYAGHGHRDRKSGQFYMLPVDVDVKDLDKTGVTGTAIKAKLKAVSGRVLVLLDACHSGSIGQSPADPGSLTDDVQRQLAAPDCGVVVMCAAMAQEEAGEAAAVKHGFFTAALLSGLQGGATPSKDGLIHLTALNFYVEEEVAELSKDEQHVVVDRPSTVTSFPLVKAPAKAEGK